MTLDKLLYNRIINLCENSTERAREYYYRKREIPTSDFLSDLFQNKSSPIDKHLKNVGRSYAFSLGELKVTVDMYENIFKLAMKIGFDCDTLFKKLLNEVESQSKYSNVNRKRFEDIVLNHIRGS